ncbi:hypothetical protein M0M57_10700 [Flavobacterium azooxidireducens]|uniref:Lipoprotein n=1 Tax=Flavobacterium azooxidireducens TaxID=1871076 RepID=A0ABY4KBB6_9FLAO|nr:succinate dehydrogenase assembly factor 2 [Flavobacterium azooxidireducens]UPQ78091.1 hypothetical protein M0M57_10700 [Flavobacterium azooxidireducens]
MKNFILILLIIPFLSCKESTNPNDSSNSNLQTVTKGCNCIKSSQDPLDFFTEEFLADLAEPAIPVVEIHKLKNYTMYKSHWKIDDSVSFFSVEEIETLSDLKSKRKSLFKNNPDLTMVEYIKTYYKSMTEEEVKKYEALLDEEAQKQNNTENEVDEETRKKLQNSALSMQKAAYTQIENLGDYAVYNKKSNDLHVVCGDIHFHIRGQVGPWGEHDKEKGLELAKLGAKKIINQCR